MSGVCAKHDRYVQPGEVCPYCEPASAKPAPPTFMGVPVIVTAAPILGGWFDGYDLLPAGWNPNATGAVPAVHQANGLILPARPAPPRDPTMRDDVRAAWDALYGKLYGKPIE